MRRFQPEHQTASEGLPLFGGALSDLRPPKAINPEERLTWARRALLLSNLDTFTAETLRGFVEDMRPELLGAGLWLGFAFRSPWFCIERHEHAQREEARARWILRYKLTPEGIRERRRMQEEIHV